MLSAIALLAMVPLLATAAPAKRASGVTIAHNNNANEVSDVPPIPRSDKCSIAFVKHPPVPRCRRQDRR